MEMMMDLQLHEHVDDVSEIVETAQKEKKIEKKLGDIETAWASFEIEYVPHKDTEMFVIKLSEEVIESLDAHQLELQTMIGMGKFVDFFRDKVVKWQRRARQRAGDGQALGDGEPQLGVARVHLPRVRGHPLAAARRHEALRGHRRRVQGADEGGHHRAERRCACAVEGRDDAMRSMKERLELCQRALNEYLDVKKKIFPRFYFVSAVALLDMLANGTNPPKIMPYLGDCFDSLANLTFVPAEGSTAETPRTSMTTTDKMVAKDREVVPLVELFSMEGEVEGYLNRLTDMMMLTLRNIMNKGIETAVDWDVNKDMPRHKWLFHYPAQVVLTGTQISWTEESEAALEELEGGQEDSVKRYLQICIDRLGASSGSCSASSRAPTAARSSRSSRWTCTGATSCRS